VCKAAGVQCHRCCKHNATMILSACGDQAGNGHASCCATCSPYRRDDDKGDEDQQERRSSREAQVEGLGVHWGSSANVSSVLAPAAGFILL
jgi:hypothetical protein